MSVRNPLAGVSKVCLALIAVTLLGTVGTVSAVVFAIWLSLKICLLKPMTAVRALAGLVRMAIEDAPRIIVTGAAVAGFAVLFFAADGKAEHCVSYLDHGSVARQCEELDVGFLDAAYQESRNFTDSIPVLSIFWVLINVFVRVVVQGTFPNPPTRTENQIQFLARRGVGPPVPPHERAQHCPRWHTCDSHAGMCFCDVVWSISMSGLCILLERRGLIFWFHIEPAQDIRKEGGHGGGQPVARQNRTSE